MYYGKATKGRVLWRDGVKMMKNQSLVRAFSIFCVLVASVNAQEIRSSAIRGHS